MGGALEGEQKGSLVSQLLGDLRKSVIVYFTCRKACLRLHLCSYAGALFVAPCYGLASR